MKMTMETKDFEQALPDILKRIGMSKNGYFKTENSAIVRVPEGFDFKGIVEKELEKSVVQIPIIHGWTMNGTL